MSEMELVSRVKLGSGKVVLLRDMKIKHQELAVQACARKAGDNQFLLGTLMQNEMLKLLIVRIDDKPVKGSDLEDLDKLFTYGEYRQLLSVIQKITGVDDSDPLAQCQVEVVTVGGK